MAAGETKIIERTLQAKGNQSNPSISKSDSESPFRYLYDQGIRS